MLDDLPRGLVRLVELLHHPVVPLGVLVHLVGRRRVGPAPVYSSQHIDYLNVRRYLVEDVPVAVEVLVHQSLGLPEVGHVLLREPVLGKLLSRLVHLVRGNVVVVVGREVEGLVVGVPSLHVVQVVEVVESLWRGYEECLSPEVRQGRPDDLLPVCVPVPHGRNLVNHDEVELLSSERLDGLPSAEHDGRDAALCGFDLYLEPRLVDRFSHWQAYPLELLPRYVPCLLVGRGDVADRAVVPVYPLCHHLQYGEGRLSEPSPAVHHTKSVRVAGYLALCLV